MALSVDAVTSMGDRTVETVVKRVWDRGVSLPFDRTKLTVDDFGNYFLRPGMIVGKNDDQSMYVPWSAASSYGAYSAYYEGIITELWDCTFESQIVAPATRANAIEERCFVWGGTVGDIPDAIKQATGHNFKARLVEWG